MYGAKIIRKLPFRFSASTSNIKFRAVRYTIHFLISPFTISSSQGNRYPIITSGDIIALRSAYNSGSYVKYWLYCHTSYCLFTSGPSKVMTTSKWSSLNGYAKFMITARGKMDGQPINSGDTVILSSQKLGSKYWLRCWTSTTYQCRFSS